MVYFFKTVRLLLLVIVRGATVFIKSSVHPPFILTARGRMANCEIDIEIIFND
jgi:hypothetical protein